MYLTKRQTATVLAALRERQARLVAQDAEDIAGAAKYDRIATDEEEFDALGVEEIDELCEKLNTFGRRTIVKADKHD